MEESLAFLQGDGELAPLLRTLATSGYDGFASLEPHLATAGTYSGFSGPELFDVAARALRQVIADVGGQERR